MTRPSVNLVLVTPSVKVHLKDFANYLNLHLPVKVYSLHKAGKHMKCLVKIFSLESVQ